MAESATELVLEYLDRLRTMQEMLPPELAKPLNQQLDHIRGLLVALGNTLTAEAAQRDAILQRIQTGLDDLVVSNTYLGFDLEATRRERDYFKRRLENS